MKTAGQYDKFHGLVMSEEPNPKCREYCLLLNKLYEGANPCGSRFDHEVSELSAWNR